jgi:hypothetical protein
LRDQGMKERNQAKWIPVRRPIARPRRDKEIWSLAETREVALASAV